MHIAILMTNTDESAFAARHPKDGAKFTALIQEARPGWTTEVHPVKDGVFPDSLAGLDGLVITGSPASARTDESWVLELCQVIRDAHEAGVPVFGACFGHQAIARALGGRLGPNDGPPVLGLVDVEVAEAAPWMRPAPGRFRIAAAHEDQVIAAPEGAVVNATEPGSPVAGYHLGNGVFTTAYHPEMTQDFIAALVEELADHYPAGVIERARASLYRPADRAVFAEWIARFFEGARGSRGEQDEMS